jgi:TonB family protein
VLANGLLLIAMAGAQPPEPKPIDPGRWVSNGDYPAAAIKNGEQGITGFRLDVDEEGGVTGCTVTSSSGSALLDETACTLLRSRAHFEPARKRGRRVASAYNSRFRWVLPDDWPQVKNLGLTILQFDLASDGTIEGCKLQNEGGAISQRDRERMCELYRERGPRSYPNFAPKYRTVRSIYEALTDDGKFTADRAEWGELLSQLQVQLDVNADEEPVSCSLVSSSVPADPDLVCNSVLGDRELIPRKPGEVTHKVRIRQALFGVSRDVAL